MNRRSFLKTMAGALSAAMIPIASVVCVPKREFIMGVDPANMERWTLIDPDKGTFEYIGTKTFYGTITSKNGKVETVKIDSI